MQWPPMPGPGIERHKAERLGRGRADDFPCVDAERVAKPRHFVRHADVDRTKSVLPQLAGLGDACGRNGMDLIDDLPVEHRRDLGRIGRNAADDLRNIVRLKLRIARIDTFGRKREQKIIVELKAFFLEHRLQNFVGRAGISGRFQNDQAGRAAYVRGSLRRRR